MASKNWNVLSWNIRGINSEDKLLALRNCIETSGCDVICLQETKRTTFDRAFIKTFCPKRFDQYAYIPSRGVSGGLITIWNSSIFTGTVVLSEFFAHIINFKATQSVDTWNLVNIYGPCQGDDRITYTNWLFDLDIPDDENWLLLGDFNYIRSPSDRNKPGGDCNDMLKFNEFIREQCLVELPIKGRLYTWSNMQSDPLLEKLDWFLTSNHWTTSFPNTMVTALAKPVSDHTPCSVTIQTSIPASKIFRFESFWTQHHNFLETVQNCWAKPSYLSNSAARVCQKLKRLRYTLKKWSKGLSRLKVLIQNSQRAVNGLDEIENLKTLTVPESNFRRILKKHTLKLLNYQNQYWRERCTIRFVKFGDENTKFFQRMATERYHHNSIACLSTANGTDVVDHAGKEALLFNTFRERLGQSSTPNQQFDLPSIIKKIDGLDELTTPFTNEEINAVVKSMPADRAPGPDGFSGQFIKTCWHIIKEDIYQLCHNFHTGDLDIESINYGYITLIPKTNSPETPNDYRPITLLNCCLKIITKILANRLQKLILKIVHRNQYGFLKGRTIQDCLAWSFEYIHQCQASGGKFFILKLDFSKAFDTIEHSAMIEIMHAMGFNDRWLTWIKRIFESGKSSVLLNGVPGRQFHCRKGVRQGDPLSPLIFVLAADLLQAAINDAMNKQLMKCPIPSVG